MTSTKKTQTTFRYYRFLPFAALLFLAGLNGCNTCVTFISNPPNSTLGIVSNDPRSVCTIPKVTMSAVRLRLGIPPAGSTGPGSGQPQHIFLTIRSMELHANASAQDDSPDWQELSLPELEQKPRQVDLVESNAAESVQQPLIATAVIPAGIYHQLRLRLVPNQPTATDRLPEKNACGGGTFNCVVTADGTVHPLQPGAGSPMLRLTLDKMEGDSLLFLPGTLTELVIEWKLAWELSSSADTGLRLLPVLAGNAKVRHIELDELGSPDSAARVASQVYTPRKRREHAATSWSSRSPGPRMVVPGCFPNG